MPGMERPRKPNTADTSLTYNVSSPNGHDDTDAVELLVHTPLIHDCPDALKKKYSFIL